MVSKNRGTKNLPIKSWHSAWLFVGSMFLQLYAWVFFYKLDEFLMFDTTALKNSTIKVAIFYLCIAIIAIGASSTALLSFACSRELVDRIRGRCFRE